MLLEKPEKEKITITVKYKDPFAVMFNKYKVNEETIKKMNPDFKREKDENGKYPEDGTFTCTISKADKQQSFYPNKPTTNVITNAFLNHLRNIYPSYCEKNGFAMQNIMYSLDDSEKDENSYRSYCERNIINLSLKKLDKEDYISFHADMLDLSIATLKILILFNNTSFKISSLKFFPNQAEQINEEDRLSSCHSGIRYYYPIIVELTALPTASASSANAEAVVSANDTAKTVTAPSIITETLPITTPATSTSIACLPLFGLHIRDLPKELGYTALANAAPASTNAAPASTNAAPTPANAVQTFPKLITP